MMKSATTATVSNKIITIYLISMVIVILLSDYSLTPHSAEAFTLPMTAERSSTTSSLSFKTKFNRASSDDDAGSNTVATMTSPPKTQAIKNEIKVVKSTPTSVVAALNKKNAVDEDSVISSIAFLDDPTRTYKKRGAPKLLSALDNKRQALKRAITKAQAKAQFEFGQRCAERAIASVLKEHGIQDNAIMP